MSSRILIVCALILALPLAQAQQPSEQSQADLAAQIAAEKRISVLLTVAQQALAGKNYAVLEAAADRLAKLRPQIGEYRFLQARAYALQDKKELAYNALMTLQKQGLTVPLKDDADFANLQGFELYDFLVEHFDTNKQPRGRSQVAVSLARGDLLLDGMAWDPSRQQFLVGSIVSGSIYRVAADGTLKPFIEPDQNNGLLAVFDIEVDAERGTLWVASAAAPHYRQIKYQDAGRSGIYQFDLDSGAFKGRYELPAQGNVHQLANLAVAPDGAVYAANALRPEVYRLGLGEQALTRFFHAPGFTTFRDLVVDPGGSYLFFSDYELGLFGVSLGERQAFQLSAGSDLNLGGIDGLEWYKDGMVLIQNGNAPHRVMRVALSADARAVAHAQALLVNQPGMDSPSEGVVVDDQFFFLASTGSRNFDPRSGKLLPGAKPEPPLILQTDVNHGWQPMQ